MSFCSDGGCRHVTAWRHKASDMFDSKVCSAGELFESFFADEASLTFAPTESWQSSGASHIWCSSCCTSWGCAIDLGRQNCPNCQRVMICRDFVEKVSACFNCWWSTSVFPSPIQTWLLALLNCQALHFLARSVCVSFWSKNAGINDKNLGPYVSVLQRKWHGVILLARHDCIEKSNFMSMDRCHHMPSYE